MTRLPLLLGWGWLGFAAAVTVVFRAWTQSLTIDEAFVYHLFLNQKGEVLFQKYDAAYHVLHTWLTWLAVHRFGKSEIVMRLPSVIAGMAYLAGAGVLARRVAGSGWKFTAGAVLLSANPLLADYLSMARGYGAALAFFVWGFIALLDGKHLVRASVLFGLSVACNLTFAVPAAAAGLTFLAVEAADRKPVLAALARLAPPGVVLAGAMVAVPLSHANAAQYYYGAQDLGTALNTLVAPSLAHSQPNRPEWVLAVERIVLPLSCAVLAVGAVFAIRRGERAVTLAAGGLTLSFAILAGAHHILGVPYPWTRTGLYLIWFFLMLCLSLWSAPATPRGLSCFAGACTVILAVGFVSQFQTRYYFDFREDAEVDQMMARVRDAGPVAPPCVGGSWLYEPTVNYYRLRYRVNWLDAMVRTGEPKPGCSWYVLLPGEARFADVLDLQRVWRGTVSGAILARAKPEP